MKKTTYYYLSLIAIMAGSLAACQDEDLGFTQEEVHEAALVRDFVKNFEARYGEIDPSHDWGLGPIPGGGAETRGTNVNSNQWDTKYHLDIPGYPDRYYDKNGNYYNTYYRGVNSYNISKNSAGNPAGDVTDEEIMYVSCWFRTHRYPESLDLHWTDFWVQDISSDNDRDADGYLVKYIPEYKYGSGLNAQQNDNFTIDQLKVKTFDGSSSGEAVAELPGYDHINNFNSGSTNHLTGVTQVPMDIENPYGSYIFTTYGDIDVSSETSREQYKKRTTQFYNSSGTEDFAAHYSQDEKWRYNAQKKYDHSIWTLVHLHFVGKSGRIYDGYYLGFDYAMEKSDANGVQELKMDGYYSNWIIKLSPGTAFQDETYTRRIMCEDLGNSHDFDFDDVVFDVKYNMTSSEHQSYEKGNNVDVTITLHAAGGTMPIWVGLNPGTNLNAKGEAHALLGKPTEETAKTQINVGASYAKSPFSIYHYTAQSIEPKDIPIYVYNTQTGSWMDMNQLSEEAYNKDDKKNKVPQKFGVPTSVLWMQESNQIETGYDQFASWVTDHTQYASWYTHNPVRSLLWGTEGEPSTSVTVGGASSSINPVIPVSTSLGHNYDVYMKEGKEGEVHAIATGKNKDDEVTISIPSGYTKCMILGSYRIGNEQFRSANNTVKTITETTTIKVDGNVYVWALDKNNNK